MALTDLNIQVKDMAVGYGHYLAIGTNGSLYSWGLNNHGQLGFGDKTNRTNPTKIGTATNWTKIACGDYHSLALNDQGEVYGWGINNVAQCKPSYDSPGFTGDDIVTPTRWTNPTSDIFFDFYNGPYLNIAANGSCSLASIAEAKPRRKTSPTTPTMTTAGFSGNLLGTGTTENNIVFDGSGPFSYITSNAYYRFPVLGKMAFGKSGFAFQSGATGIYYTGNKGQYSSFLGNSFDRGFHFQDVTDRQPGGYDPNVDLPPRKLQRKKNDVIRDEVYPGRYSEPLEEDDNKYIDFDLGDEFLLAIDSNNRLWGMSWANDSGSSMASSIVAPMSPVGNFGWVLYQPIDGAGIRPNNVNSGLELIDESRLWLNVSCGARHAIISDVDGNIFSMGNNAYGQLGRDYTTTSNITTINQLESPANTTGFKIHACGPQASLIAKES